MSIHIAALLDKAKDIHSLPSDYKLALVMGISHTALISYRAGKTLPDARVISKICELTGDDPEILAAEIEAERAKTPEARALWRSVVERLSMTARHGVAAGVFSVAAGGALLAGFPSGNAYAAQAQAAFKNIHIVELSDSQKCRRRVFFFHKQFSAIACSTRARSAFRMF